MVELLYSLIIEATEDPDFFGFYSPDLEGFTGIGHSIEDCIYKAKWGMKEHVKLFNSAEASYSHEKPQPENHCSERTGRRAMEHAGAWLTLMCRDMGMPECADELDD